MAVFDTKHQRAAWVVAILGVIVAIGLAPYASGLLGAPVLYVIFAGLHRRLSTWIGNRAVAAVLVIIVAIISVVVPIAWLITLLVGQAQDAVNAIIHSQVLDRIDTITIGSFQIGPQIHKASEQAVAFLGQSAFGLLGRATRITLNLVFTFIALYYLLLHPRGAWGALRPYIPFSDENVESLRARFVDVTISTIIGTGLAAILQGIAIAGAFVVTDLSNAVFWGAIVAVTAILPIVGTALVWLPAAIVLFIDGHTGQGIGMIVWGVGVGAVIDHLFRPWVSGRYASVHPFLILVGAVAGVTYLGILGLLLGPLALSYFFEILRMYQKEYLPQGA